MGECKHIKTLKISSNTTYTNVKILHESTDMLLVGECQNIEASKQHLSTLFAQNALVYQLLDLLLLGCLASTKAYIGNAHTTLENHDKSNSWQRFTNATIHDKQHIKKSLIKFQCTHNLFSTQ